MRLLETVIVDGDGGGHGGLSSIKLQRNKKRGFTQRKVEGRKVVHFLPSWWCKGWGSDPCDLSVITNTDLKDPLSLKGVFNLGAKTYGG